jgi:GAF domain/ANTAR domain
LAEANALRAAIAAAMATRSATPGQRVDAVCRTCVAALPVDGGAFTLMASDADRHTVAASDPIVAAVEEAQFALGEGPSLQAFLTRRPVLVSDLPAAPAALWPLLRPAIADLPVGALYTIPLQLGAITIGVCALYRRAPAQLGTDELAFTLTAVDIATLALLALRAGQLVEGGGGIGPDADPVWQLGDASGRIRVHQAIGMLIGQLDVPAEGALARLRAYSFAVDRPLTDVADDIVNLRLRLTDDTSRG